MSRTSQRNDVGVPAKRPNYRVRVSVAGVIVAAIAATIMVLTPIATTSSWQYWVSITAIAVSIWMFFQLEPLPAQGRKRPESYGRRRGSNFVLVLGVSLLAFVAHRSCKSTIKRCAGLLILAWVDYRRNRIRRLDLFNQGNKQFLSHM